jgi:hypothetical protein
MIPVGVSYQISFTVFLILYYFYVLRERERLGDPGVDGRIISRWIFRKWNWGGIDWMELAKDGDRWRALVNVVMNLQVP